MRLCHLLPGAGLLILLSCQKPEASQDRATGHLTFRVGCAEGIPNAHPEAFLGQTWWFGPEEHFELQYAGPSVGINNAPAITFEIEEAQKPAFEAMTTRCINLPLAIYVDGQFICAPTVYNTLPGGGIIDVGQSDFSPEERDRLLKILRGS